MLWSSRLEFRLERGFMSFRYIVCFAMIFMLCELVEKEGRGGWGTFSFDWGICFMGRGRDDFWVWA